MSSGARPCFSELNNGDVLYMNASAECLHLYTLTHHCPLRTKLDRPSLTSRGSHISSALFTETFSGHHHHICLCRFEGNINICAY